MHGNGHQSSNLVVAGSAGVAALIAATLSAYALTGFAQALALAVCFAVMGASVVVSMAEQHKQEKATKPQVVEAPELASNRRLSAFSGLEIQA